MTSIMILTIPFYGVKLWSDTLAPERGVEHKKKNKGMEWKRKICLEVTRRFGPFMTGKTVGPWEVVGYPILWKKEVYEHAGHLSVSDHCPS